MNDIRTGDHSLISVASLVLGPGLMAIGDLFHPPESADALRQVAIVAAHSSHWYLAHLLLFLGLLVFVPGFLAITKLAADRRPSLGYASRVLLLIAVGALSTVFVFEMLLGRFLAAGGDTEAAVILWNVFFESGAVFGALLPGLLGFFVGVGIFVATLAWPSGPYRWPALCFGLGALLILGEIILAEVLLSQIGNMLILVGSVGCARVILRKPHPDIA